jgi:hypothetical protein
VPQGETVLRLLPFGGPAVLAATGYLQVASNEVRTLRTYGRCEGFMR